MVKDGEDYHGLVFEKLGNIRLCLQDAQTMTVQDFFCASIYLIEEDGSIMIVSHCL